MVEIGVRFYLSQVPPETGNGDDSSLFSASWITRLQSLVRRSMNAIRLLGRQDPQHTTIVIWTKQVARRHLEGPLTAALIDLAKAYHLVEMHRPVDRNECIEFGPLARRPEETTGDLSALIDVLNALGACELVVATLVSPGNPFRD